MTAPSTRAPAPPGLVLWSALAAAILAQQVGSKTVRDGLFLTQVSAALLPRAMLLSALLSVPIVLGVSTAITRRGPRRSAAQLLVFSGGAYLVESALFGSAPVLTAWLAYVHTATLGGVTLSAFFSNVAEQFDPHSARTASSRVISGAAVGGVIGGLGTSFLSRTLDPRALLAMLALINGAAGFVLARVPAPVERGAGDHSGWGLPLALGSLTKSAYLRGIAYLVLLTGFSSALLDFNFKSAAAASYGSGPGLLELFAAFHTATAIITAIVQLGVAQPALERLGLAGTLATLPGSLLLGGALGPFVPRLWSTVVLRGASSVLESSLFRSAYEPLYTPLSQHRRRSTKTLIDVAAGRLGEAAASATLLGLALLSPRSSYVPALACAMIAAAVALLLSVKMHSGYVAELAASLRKGSVRLHPSDMLDSTTRLTLSQTHVELERSQLLAAIAAQRASQPPPSSQLSAADNALLFAAGELLSASHARVLQVLRRGPLDARLVPIAIQLLQQPALVEPISSALQSQVEQIVGQLVDAMRDPQQTAEVRRRLPFILRTARDPRAVEGLLAALRAPERALRQRAALALVAITAERPELAPTSDQVFELLRSELAEPDHETASLRHVFAILSLTLDRDALRLSQEAIGSGDARQRGTALEYLHSTLPEPLRSELVTWLDLRTPRREDDSQLLHTARPPLET